jgi:GTP cyclohydrolase I
MKDAASEQDARGITIQRVGVRDLHLPIMIREKRGANAHVLGLIDASVELPKTDRGTHMSRFVSILTQWAKKSVSMSEMEQMLRDIVGAFNSRAGSLKVGFTYFLDKRAPASGIESPLDYECRFEAEIEEGAYSFQLVVTVPVITLCPCSKEISERGAHNQRALLTVWLASEPGHIIWLEDLIPLLEAQGSCEIYPLLKRVDEKVITECSYDNPKFVEDVVRDAVLALRGLPGARRFIAECESIESIHNHVAYARAEGCRDATGEVH